MRLCDGRAKVAKRSQLTAIHLHTLQRNTFGGGDAVHVACCALNSQHPYATHPLHTPQRNNFGGGDVVHVASCDYIYLLGVTILGKKSALPQETLKVHSA